MTSRKQRYFIISFLILCVLASLALFSFDAFAMEGPNKGRKLWDTVMLWVNFGILVVVFMKYARRPLMNFLNGERAKVEEDLKTVEDRIKEARSLMEIEAEKLEGIEERIEKIREDAMELGRKDREKIIAKAEDAASHMIEDAKKEAIHMTASARKMLGDEMLGMAASLAAEKIKERMTQEDNEKIISRFASDLSTVKEKFSQTD